jgi:hypothetical protein
VERHEVAVTENCNNAAELVYSMSSGGGVCSEAGKAEILGHKTNKNFWIDQVESKWEKHMFQLPSPELGRQSNSRKSKGEAC